MQRLRFVAMISRPMPQRLSSETCPAKIQDRKVTQTCAYRPRLRGGCLKPETVSNFSNFCMRLLQSTTPHLQRTPLCNVVQHIYIYILYILYNIYYIYILYMHPAVWTPAPKGHPTKPYQAIGQVGSCKPSKPLLQVLPPRCPRRSPSISTSKPGTGNWPTLAALLATSATLATTPIHDNQLNHSTWSTKNKLVTYNIL